MAKQSRASLPENHQISSSRRTKRGQSRIWPISSRKLEPLNNRTVNRGENQRIRRNNQIRHNRQIHRDSQNWRDCRVIWMNLLVLCSVFVFRHRKTQLRLKRLGLPAFVLPKPNIFSQFGTWRCFPATGRSIHTSASSPRLGLATVALVSSYPHSGGPPTPVTRASLKSA